jgi:biotin transport system substrate-specific component
MRPDAATLRWAVFPQSGLLTDAALVLAGASFVALAAQVSFDIPGTPVPITGQTFAVLLVGATLGAVLALASIGLYVFVGALGAPIYADGHHGWDVLTGPTGGYIVGFVLAVALTGWLAQRRWDRRFGSAVAAMLTGNVVIFAVGLPWLAADQHLGFEDTLEAGLYPFVVGEVVKLYVAGALLPGAWRLVERFRGTRD